MTYVQRGKRIADVLRELDEQAKLFNNEDQGFTCRLGDTAASLCDVRAEMQSRVYADNLKLLAIWLDINDVLKSWAAKFSSTFDLGIEHLESSSKDAFEGHYHAYQSLWSA
jgi:hypothetical protein